MDLTFDSNARFKLFIDITTKCNLNCSYCFARKTKSWNKEISIKNFKFFLNTLKYSDRKFYIILFGGEPLMHSKINEIIELIKKEEDLIFIALSNGLLELKKYIDFLSLPNTIISFTFHKNLKKFLQNLEKLNNFYNKITINILLENKEHKKLYNFANKNNIKYIFTQIYDDNEIFINPEIIYNNEYNYIFSHNIKLTQDNFYYPNLIKNHYKIKNKKKLCYFNEGNIDMNLNYSDFCRNIQINLLKQPYFFKNKIYKKPIICNKNCGDCYGKIIAKKIIKN